MADIANHIHANFKVRHDNNFNALKHIAFQEELRISDHGI